MISRAWRVFLRSKFRAMHVVVAETRYNIVTKSGSDVRVNKARWITRHRSHKYMQVAGLCLHV